MFHTAKMPRKGRAAGKKKQAPAAVANEDVAITAVAGEAANVLWDEMKKMGFCEDGTEVSEVAKAMKQIELVFGYFDRSAAQTCPHSQARRGP